MTTDKPITRERLLRVLDGQIQKTDRLIAALLARGPAAFDRPARDDGWTAKEILAHMAWGYLGLLTLAEGQAPPGSEAGAFDLDAFNETQRQKAASLPLADVLARLATARARLQAAIEATPEDDYGRVVHTPWMGDHSLGQFLMFPALHEGGHRQEIERWQAAQEDETP
jgi:hypothetical protein